MYTVMREAFKYVLLNEQFNNGTNHFPMVAQGQAHFRGAAGLNPCIENLGRYFKKQPAVNFDSD